MVKFGKSFRKNIVENYYRLLSLANVTINKVAIPTADKGTFHLEIIFTKDYNNSVKLYSEKHQVGRSRN